MTPNIIQVTAEIKKVTHGTFFQPAAATQPMSVSLPKLVKDLLEKKSDACTYTWTK